MPGERGRESTIRFFRSFALYYAGYTRTSLAKAFSHVNWKWVGILAAIIYIAALINSYHNEIKNILNREALVDVRTFSGFLFISLLAFTASWLLGPSGKFAGILAMLTAIYESSIWSGYLRWNSPDIIFPRCTMRAYRAAVLSCQAIHLFCGDQPLDADPGGLRRGIHVHFHLESNIK